MKFPRTFLNLPRRRQLSPTTPEPEKKEEDLQPVEKGVVVRELLTILIWGGIFLYVVIKLWTVGKTCLTIRQELLFTYSHANLVKPIREIYETSHQKTDEDLKQIFTGKN